MKFIKNNTYKSEDELEIIQYGIEIFLINLFKNLFLIGVAAALGVAKPLVVLLISFGCVRIFAAGVHAPSTFVCTILNFVCFLGGTYLCLFVPIHTMVRMIIIFISVILLMQYAPADSEERPLVSECLRQKLKLQSILAVNVLFMVTLIIDNETYKNLITCGILLEAVMTTPVIYYILGKGYRNYEKFNEKINGK
jgi:accessory gene regulator B